MLVPIPFRIAILVIRTCLGDLNHGIVPTLGATNWISHDWDDVVGMDTLVFPPDVVEIRIVLAVAGIALFVLELERGKAAVFPMTETGWDGNGLRMDAFRDVGFGDQVADSTFNSDQVTGLDAELGCSAGTNPHRIAVGDFSQPFHGCCTRLLVHVEFERHHDQFIVLHRFVPRNALEGGHRVEAIFGPFVHPHIDDPVARREADIVFAVTLDADRFAVFADDAILGRSSTSHVGSGQFFLE